MISGETMRFREVRRILRYYVPNKLSSPEIFAQYLMPLFLQLKDEKQLLSGCPPLCQKTARTRSPGCCKQEQNKV